MLGLLLKTSYKFDVTQHFYHINVMASLERANTEKGKSASRPVFLFICEKCSFFELNVDNGLDNVLCVYEVSLLLLQWQHRTKPQKPLYAPRTNNTVLTYTKSFAHKTSWSCTHRTTIIHFLGFWWCSRARIKTQDENILSATFTFMFSRCINQITKVKNHVLRAPFTAETPFWMARKIWANSL